MEYRQYKSGSVGAALANIGIDYDSMGNGSKSFEFESQDIDYSEFEATGGGSDKGKGDGDGKGKGKGDRKGQPTYTPPPKNLPGFPNAKKVSPKGEVVLDGNYLMEILLNGMDNMVNWKDIILGENIKVLGHLMLSR